jgi:hypothetical protein
MNPIHQRRSLKQQTFRPPPFPFEPSGLFLAVSATTTAPVILSPSVKMGEACLPAGRNLSVARNSPLIAIALYFLT